MFGIIRKKKQDVRDRTVYMEVCGDNKVAYRVIAGRLCGGGYDVVTYGIEAQDLCSGEYECIPDFSRDIEDAVDFAEMLILFFLRFFVLFCVRRGMTMKTY